MLVKGVRMGEGSGECLQLPGLTRSAANPDVLWRRRASDDLQHGGLSGEDQVLQSLCLVVSYGDDPKGVTVQCHVSYSMSET